MAKSRLTLAKLREKGLICPAGDSKTTALFNELMTDSKTLPQTSKGERKDEDLEHVGETIMPVNVTNVAFLEEGGMGIVYLGVQHPLNYVAVQTNTDRKALQKEFEELGPVEFSRKYDSGLLKRLFASKYLLGGLKSSEKMRKRFEREGKILEKLGHPRVPHAIYSDSNVIVANYFPHTVTMDEIINDTSRTVWEKAKIAEHTAKIFAELREQAKKEGRPIVLHRDIKPSNILVYRPGIDNVESFIIDWGLASDPEFPDEDLDTDDPTVTETGVVMGTPLYMPPEVVTEGMKDIYDERSDVYGIGATLYHLLANRPPFKQLKTTPMTLFGIMEGGAPKVSDVNQKVPTGLSAIIGKAISKDPEDRFQTTTELYEALKEETPKIECVRSAPAPKTSPDLVYHSDSSVADIAISPASTLQREVDALSPKEVETRVTAVRSRGEPTVIDTSIRLLSQKPKSRYLPQRKPYQKNQIPYSPKKLSQRQSQFARFHKKK